jgi:hypothetical protein
MKNEVSSWLRQGFAQENPAVIGRLTSLGLATVGALNERRVSVHSDEFLFGLVCSLLLAEVR